MKKIILSLLLLTAGAVYCQKEASNWYFGYNAGIRFLDDGTIEPLAGNAMQTNEGCSTISDANGNLLFYTDGRSVWDRNHVLMPNGNYNAGTGLHGDPSSTQSAIIVPKKGSPNIYYVFTVDEPHHQNAAVYPNQFTGNYMQNGQIEGSVPTVDDGYNNGLNYSVIDLNVTGSNGSIGDIISRNNHLITYDPSDISHLRYKCSEKVTATANASKTGYWVITHFIDKFYAFEVTASGVNSNPVVTQAGPLVPLSGYRRNAIGCLKASPNSKKIAIAHNQKGTATGALDYNGGVYLYDFDNATGTLSNSTTIIENITAYGVEFSASAKKLYVTSDTGVGGGYTHQFDLLSSDIQASKKIVEVDTQGTLQLAPNGKIYKARPGSFYITVIHYPEEDGQLCRAINYETFLNGAGYLGLPPFISSFFLEGILTKNYCLGQATQFEINSDDSFDSIVWDFGDGTLTSSDTAPSHTYVATGNYIITATITRNGQTSTVKSNVTISDTPIANTAQNIVMCDTDNDGFEEFDLSVNDAIILGSQTNAFVSYYTSLAEAQNASNFENWHLRKITNTTNPQTIYARVNSYGNLSCQAITSFQIILVTAPALSTNTYAICDDATDGNDANGLATFNMSAVTTAILPNSSSFNVEYYASQNDAENELNPLPQQFATTVSGQQVVFIRISAASSQACTTILPVTLRVNALPGITDATLIACDNDGNPDGLTQFNLKNADGFYTNGDPDHTVVYYHNQADAQNQVNALPSLFTNTVNPQHFTARVTNAATGCYRILPFHIEVQGGTTTPVTLDKCDSDGTADGFTLFNLADAGLETAGTVVNYYASAADMQQQQNPISKAYTNTSANQQLIFAHKAGAGCDTFYEINLIVISAPLIDTEETTDACQSELPVILTAGTNNNTYTYLWSNGATVPSIPASQPGTYTVTVTNTSGCSSVRTVTLNVADIATIDDVVINDLNDNNTVTVVLNSASGTAFQYSLDKPNGPYQDSNVFQDVTPGPHTVYVYSTSGCGIVHRDIIVLGVPKFFTPNDDGNNDTWNIKGISADAFPDCRIYVYDRYGKLITGINPKGRGWDGRFDGQYMPATDYWYVVELGNGRTAKGHFSLVR